MLGSVGSDPRSEVSSRVREVKGYPEMGDRSETCPLRAFPIRPGEARLEQRATALGRRLAGGLAQQDDEDNEMELELELEDEPDVKLSGVVFSPLKR